MRRLREPLIVAWLALVACACESAETGLLSNLPLGAAITPPRRPLRRCPPEMVDVRGRFCIDRYEATLVEPKSGRAVSPYYNPSRKLALRDHRDWTRRAERVGPLSARKLPLPELPAW
jgi:hypothetical protein